MRGGAEPSTDETVNQSSQQEQVDAPVTDNDEQDDTAGETDAPQDDSAEDGVADCNASLAKMGITGFTFPDDLTAINHYLYMGGSASVTYCPVAEDRYEAILQALFSDTGMTVTTPTGDAVSSLDDVVAASSNIDSTQHAFLLSANGRTYSVFISYAVNEYDDYITVYEPQTLSISISEIYE